MHSMGKQVLVSVSRHNFDKCMQHDHVPHLAPLRDDATKSRSALSLLAKSALNSTRLVAFASAETFSELAVRHLRGGALDVLNFLDKILSTSL